VLTGTGVAVYDWRECRLEGAYYFPATEAGLDQFSRYLSETPNVPTYIMADLLEEEYRLEVIPHVFGRDRKALIQHRLARLFRDTPYVYSQIQGRMPDGRRDDKILLTALTNPKTLAPWLQHLSRHQEQLAAIWSLPLVSDRLMRQVGGEASNALLISMHSASGLRQSYFENGYLKISRLVRVPGLERTQSPSTYILREVENIRRYLVSMRLFMQDRPLDVYILSHGAIRADLEKRVESTSMINFHLPDVVAVAAECGMGDYPDSSNCDALLAHLVMQRPPANHYAGKQDRRHFRIFRARTVMYAASVVLLVVSIVVSGMNMVDGISLKEQSIASARQGNYYQARYQMAREKLPATPVEAGAMKQAVEIVDTVRLYRAVPAHLMAAISAVLYHYPDLRIDKIDWHAVARDPDTPETRSNPYASNPLAMTFEDTPGMYHTAEISGTVESFDGDYHKALDLVNDFANTLAGDSSIRKVQRIRMPLNVSSEEKMSGDVGMEGRQPNAVFTLKVVMFKPNETT